MKLEEQNQHVKKEFGLSNLAVNNKTSIIILSFIIAILGIMAYVTMPKETFPEIVIPTIYIGTPYAGNSPVDIENLVSRPIEKEIKSLTGVKKINSTSIQDYSTIIVEFNPDVDVSEALQDTKDAVDKAKKDLPNDLDADPNVFEVNFSEFPIMNVNISGDYSIDELKDFAEYLQDEIEAMSEISKADIRGALEREIRIDADPFKMEAREVSFSDIQNAIAAENLTLSGGDILSGDFRRSLRIDGEFTNVNQINDVIIKSEKGNIVYLQDVATVSDSYAERKNYARSSKLPVVTLDVVKRSGENLIIAADNIKEVIDEAKKNRFPPDLDVSITNDQSKQARSQINNLENSIISGVILVVVVLMFFLGFRNALFVGVAIPMSIFMAIMILNAAGVTLNIMVLFSLILALGMLVDNGIVVVENIYRLMQEGYSPIKAAKEGVGEVALPIISSTMTTLAAFVPLAFWGGIIGEFMKFLPITLIIVLASSLFVALVINPVLTSIYMKVEGLTPKAFSPKRFFIRFGLFILLGILFYGVSKALAHLFFFIAILIPLYIFVVKPFVQWYQENVLTWLEAVYAKTITFALNGVWPLIIFLGTWGLLFASIIAMAISSPKVVFFPINQPAYINIFIQEPIGTDIETTNIITKQVEEDIVELMKPYDFMVEAIIAQVGEGTADPNEGPSQGATPHKARITVSFVEFQFRRGVSTEDLMNKIRAEINKKYAERSITVDKNQDGPPVGKPINLEISGENLDKLIAITKEVKAIIESSSIKGIEELKLDLEVGKPEMLVTIDRDAARRFGLSTSTIAMELRTALFGSEVSKYKEGEDEYPIQLRLADEFRYDIDALKNKKITFRDKFGNLKQIPIKSVAQFENTDTYGSIKRKDLDRVITLSSNVEVGYNPTEINAQIQELLQDYIDNEKPEGYEIDYTGEQEEQAKSMQFLMFAMFLAVSMIFLIIVAQFNSLSIPFIIMFSVILSTIGVFLGLNVFNMDFVIIMTGIGIISLAGVVVNNAIVLIDYTNLVRKRKQQELELAEGERLSAKDIVLCIIEGGKTRLRPVLLTAITTVLGLIPLAIGMNINFFTLFERFDAEYYAGGDNAIFWGPMAWTVIFGLVFATFLTLIVVPVMYLLVERLKLRLAKK